MRSPIDRALLLIGLVVWPATVFAAGTSFGAELSTITLRDWVSLALVSFVGGLMALLYRLKLHLELLQAEKAGEPVVAANRMRVAWQLYAVYHFAGSQFAGLLCFFACEARDTNNYTEAALIAVVALCGAALVDRLAERGPAWFSGIFDRQRVL